MAADPKNTQDDFLDAIKDLTAELKKNSDKLDDAVKKQTDSRSKQTKKTNDLLGRNTMLNQTMMQNTQKITGLVRGMLSLHGMIGNVRQSNDELVKALARSGEITKQAYADTMITFRSTGNSMTEAVAVMSTMVDMGMRNFSKSTQQFAGRLTVLGVSNKNLLNAIRFNTQSLMMTEESSLTLAKELTSTAMKFGDSIDGLIGVINSLKDSFMQTSAELGSKTTASIQAAIGILSAGRSDIQAQLGQFVSSLTKGTSGFMKSAIHGQTFTGGMDTGAVVAAIRGALASITSMGGGGEGVAGNQYILEAFAAKGMFDQSDLALSKSINKNLTKLQKSDMQQRVEAVSQLSFERAWQKAMYRVNELAMKGIVGLTGMINKYFKYLPVIALGMTALGIIAGVIPAVVKSILALKPFLARIGLVLVPLVMAVRGLWTAVKNFKEMGSGSVAAPLAAGAATHTALKIAAKRTVVKAAATTGLRALLAGTVAATVGAPIATALGVAFLVNELIGLTRTTKKAIDPIAGMTDFFTEGANALFDGNTMKGYADATAGFEKVMMGAERDAARQRKDSLALQEDSNSLLRSVLQKEQAKQFQPLSLMAEHMSNLVAGQHELIEKAGDGNKYLSTSQKVQKATSYKGFKDVLGG